MNPPSLAPAALFVLLTLVSGCARIVASSDAADASADAPPRTDASLDVPRLVCGPRETDEGDACVSWRELPAPPCAPVALTIVDGAVTVRCEGGLAFALGLTFAWDQVLATGPDLVPEEASDLPERRVGPSLVVRLTDGTRVWSHGDVYAHPAAMRTDPAGAWRDTLAPPSASLTHATALSEREALFVGSRAFVYTITRR